MRNRLRLLRLATALLYFGPLLAGLAGQSWTMVPMFVGCFILWSIILRPQLWPTSLSDLAQPQGAVALASLIATQTLLVVVCLALGRGIGGVAGLQPELPYFLPAALSFLSVPLSRLIWTPHVQAENVGFDPIAQDLTDQQAVPQEELAGPILAEVLALPDNVTETELQRHLTAIAAHLDPVIIRQSLGDVVAKGLASRAGVKALIIHATDPSVSTLFSGQAYPKQGFAAAGSDAKLLTLFARRCALVLDDEPELAPDCPPAADILLAAKGVGDEDATAALQRLAGRLDQARPA
jgi:hypothetical protein